MSYASEQTYVANNQALQTRLGQLETLLNDLFGKVDERFVIREPNLLRQVPNSL